MADEMTEVQIKYMTERFLSWKLPENFNPDAGISFSPAYNTGTEYEGRHQPYGTNLFDYTQAKAMVQHMVEGLPDSVGDKTAALLSAYGVEA